MKEKYHEFDCNFLVINLFSNTNRSLSVGFYFLKNCIKIHVESVSTCRNNIAIESGDSKMAQSYRKRKNEKTNQQLIRTYSFSEGQIVFAKLRGYPNWPARVRYLILNLIKFYQILYAYSINTYTMLAYSDNLV